MVLSGCATHTAYRWRRVLSKKSTTIRFSRDDSIFCVRTNFLIFLEINPHFDRNPKILQTKKESFCCYKVRLQWILIKYPKSGPFGTLRLNTQPICRKWALQVFSSMKTRNNYSLLGIFISSVYTTGKNICKISYFASCKKLTPVFRKYP